MEHFCVKIFSQKIGNLTRKVFVKTHHSGVSGSFFFHQKPKPKNSAGSILEKIFFKKIPEKMNWLFPPRPVNPPLCLWATGAACQLAGQSPAAGAGVNPFGCNGSASAPWLFGINVL
ncbi:plectin-like [Platysternon megacephalum]|uniref:Plectin-like n=1 Tax=Platysternon megacephalum TaxID=55544 RepID=A0A4D9DMW7_9SAUR|nr:plectin-like [Platysternon megacephalum]